MKQIHKDLYNFLDVINKYSEKHKIKLFAAYGTLLGAIRDGGIIEWDDDIDLKIFEEEEDKLIVMMEEMSKELGWTYYFHASINAYKFKTKNGAMLPIDIFIWRKTVEKVSLFKKIKTNLILVKLFKWKEIKVLRSAKYRFLTYLVKPLAHILVLKKVTHDNVIKTLLKEKSSIYADVSSVPLWEKSKTFKFEEFNKIKFGPSYILVQKDAEERLTQEYKDWKTPEIWADHGNQDNHF